MADHSRMDSSDSARSSSNNNTNRHHKNDQPGDDANDNQHNDGDKTKIDKTKIFGFELDLYKSWQRLKKKSKGGVAMTEREHEHQKSLGA